MNDFRKEILAETSWTELVETSGIWDESRGRELNNYEALEGIAINGLGAYKVYLNSNGDLSPEASKHNSMVTRSGQGEHKVTVVAKYLPS